jgi:hypothetical protein
MSIKNGGKKKLNFQTKGVDTCVNLCKDVRIKGICNFGSSCQVRTIEVPTIYIRMNTMKPK